MEAKNAANKPPAWPTNVAKAVATLRGHGDSILSMAFANDRSLLASASKDGKARLWEVGAAARERSILDTRGDPFSSFAFAPSGRLLAAGSGSLNGWVRVIDVSDKAAKEVAVLKGGRGTVHAVAFAPDGKSVAGAGEDRTLRVWDLGSSKGEPRTQLAGHAKTIRAMAFAPDGQGVATASQDATVRLWSLSRIRSSERASLPHKTEVTGVAWSADGKTVTTLAQDGVIRFWDPTAMKPTPRNELNTQLGAIRVFQVSPDARTMVTVTDGPRVMNWDLATGQPVGEWKVEAGPVSAVALTPDGRYLAAGAVDGTITIFRVAEKRA